MTVLGSDILTFVDIHSFDVGCMYYACSTVHVVHNYYAHLYVSSYIP